MIHGRALARAGRLAGLAVSLLARAGRLAGLAVALLARAGRLAGLAVSLLARALALAPARGSVQRRFALAGDNDEGGPDTRPLRHATEDASLSRPACSVGRREGWRRRAARQPQTRGRVHYLLYNVEENRSLGYWELSLGLSYDFQR
jgi:hypothetical protein